MTVRLLIEAFGETQLSRELMRFADAAADPVPMFHLVHESFLHAEKEQFDTEGGAGATGKWAPLAQSTIDRKAAQGLDPRILRATGLLEKSLTDTSDAAHVFQIEGDVLTMGSSDPIGVFHQSTEPRHRLPRRPPVDLTEDTKREWVRIVQRWLVGAA